jgi:Fibronectin type III domain
MKRIALVAAMGMLALSASMLVAAPIASASCNSEGGANFLPTTAAAFDIPSEPQNLMVAPGNQSVVLFWEAPANEGGGVDFYRVYVDGVRRLKTTQTQIRVNNLANGHEYSFWVTAVNDCGESDPSNTVTATPSTGQDARLIGGTQLSMSTGQDPTASDPFVAAQTFPPGTTGIGTLDEEPDMGFCLDSCLANRVLVNSLQNGSLGGAFYTITLKYDKTVLTSTDSAVRGGTSTTGFTVYYNATKGETATEQLAKCSVAPVPCVARMAREDGDLFVKVRTDDIDPRLGTR